MREVPVIIDYCILYSTPNYSKVSFALRAREKFTDK